MEMNKMALRGRRTGLPVRSRGLTLVEVAISISLLGLILVGVMGSLSTSFLTQRSNSDVLECQLMTQRVLEELQSTPFKSLPSFNGTYVDDGASKHRARIHVKVAGMNLVQVEVSTVSLVGPNNGVRAVTMIANTE